MGNAYATPTAQQAPSTPQVAPTGLDANQALVGNAETQARMTGAPMELEVNPNEIGQARAATKAARSEVRAIDPDAELGDFFPIIRVFERASSDAREALATHLQIPTLEDWLEAAQSDFEAQMNNVLPLNMMAIALGLHVRCGIEDTIWRPDRSGKMSSVEQIEQLVRLAGECARPVATAKEAREIYKVGTFYSNADETLAANGFAPNRLPKQANQRLRAIA